ncbi:PDZ domain-containing protein [Nocardioides albertanoniae]|uniref:endopeptidase La n=1 Tax=Nocardioides albertanoniae TaxID=1175486 RepID=A0A543A461_9ACTN|nr:PDZ domain-containing protein [Nocardioides albertanoniae]TQL67368.1 PDZ domain-containing protein [Nocardioides albertanoniae]
MTQRTLAGLIALPLVVALIVIAWVVPLPYTIYSPGPTVNVLGKFQNKDIVQVKDHKAYRNGEKAQLRMTTVSETTREARLGLWTLLGAWMSETEAVYPREVAYPDQGTVKEDREAGQVQMASAQDAAIAAALTELGEDVDEVSVAEVTKNAPATGKLAAGDVVTKVGTKAVDTPQAVVNEVQKVKPGTTLEMTIRRKGKSLTQSVKTGEKEGKAFIGVSLGATYTFPYDIKITLDPAIGGPSAGLMMALSVYDTLTKGPLTDNKSIAGTGTIDGSGNVGPIGGIQQKIPGAANDGAKLFLVPAGNCQDIQGAAHGDMRLTRVKTLEDAIKSIETWTKDPNAKLPTCGSTK